PQVAALAGTLQVIELAVTIGFPQAWPPTVTVAPAWKLVPVMVIEVATLLMPYAGATFVIVGAWRVAMSGGVMMAMSPGGIDKSIVMVVLLLPHWAMP